MQTALDLRRALRSAETKRRYAQAMRRKLRCMSAEACQRQPGVDVKRSLQDRSAYVAVGRTADPTGVAKQGPESRSLQTLRYRLEALMHADEDYARAASEPTPFRFAFRFPRSAVASDDTAQACPPGIRRPMRRRRRARLDRGP